MQYRQSLHPILEPFDLKGIGVTSYRYLDPDHQDDSWLYLPSLRRVRRLSAAQRSDALFGQDTDLDSYYGYDGHPAWMDWKLLGEGEMLGVVHGANYPVKWAPGRGNFAFDEVWEKRPVWIIEGTSKFPQYSYGKRVIYVDKEAYVVLYSDIYDRAGELWKVWVNDYTFRKQTPAGKVVYEDEMGFGPALMMIDTQAQHATRLMQAVGALAELIELVGALGVGFERGARVVQRRAQFLGDDVQGLGADIRHGFRRRARSPCASWPSWRCCPGFPARAHCPARRRRPGSHSWTHRPAPALP
mgnify:CR=1 FL=1